MAPSTVCKQETIVDSEHRRKFNFKAFGTTFETDEEKKETLKQRRRILTKKQYEAIMLRVRYWDVQEGYTDPKTKVQVTQKELWKSCEKSWYNKRLHYRLQNLQSTFDDRPVDHLQYLETRKSIWRIVLHEEMVFDAIRSCHLAVGHKKLLKTKEKALSIYYNLTEDLCRIFIDTCPVCNSLTSGAGIPTLTDGRFRERYTVCTVDYSTRPVKDINGVVLKQLLVLQDKATKLTVLCPIWDIELRVL